MNNTIFSIGSNVNYKNSKFMKNGIVTGIDQKNERLFITWPIHGVSSIHISNIELSTPPDFKNTLNP